MRKQRMDRIDFISAYCDRWCERCAFTMRCSTFAVEAAIAMCEGDVEAAIKLAVGRPHPVDGARGARERDAHPDLPDFTPTEAEMREFEREEDAREERIDESPITTQAKAVAMLGMTWLRDRREACLATGDPALKEAVEIAGWDVHFIEVKLHRALHGRDEYRHGNPFGLAPVQNDWNGSAKVALLSIVRSADAWQIVADGRSDADAADLARRLRELRAAVEREFPDAWTFVRPGFDEPGR
jgi:hypothetical protein